MVKRLGTKQRKTRSKFTRNIRDKGKLSLSRYFQEFKEGDMVNLTINSSIAFGRFFPRFHGLTGKVVGRKGRCYEVVIKDGEKEKRLTIHPIHLKKVGGQE